MKIFKNRIYLITGANSGIGKRLSEELIAREAELFLVDKDVDNIQELVMTARRCGGGIFNLNTPDDIPALFRKAKDEGIKFDGLIYCAGISPLMTLKDLDIELLQSVYNINIISFIGMLKYFTDEEYTNPGSSIIGISSSTSVYGGNRQYAYSSSKAAMNSIIKNCSEELSLRNIRVNAIMPSITNTEMVKKLREQSDAIDANVRYKMPFGILEPDDIVRAILYLLSDDCKLTGTVLPVNNGEVY